MAIQCCPEDPFYLYVVTPIYYLLLLCLVAYPIVPFVVAFDARRRAQSGWWGALMLLGIPAWVTWLIVRRHYPRQARR